MTQVLKHYSDYNHRRYSRPWVALVDNRGQYDFGKTVGTWTGDDRGGEGDLVIFAPVEGQVYGYGQKDYRRPSASDKLFAIWAGDRFTPSDRLGRTD